MSQTCRMLNQVCRATFFIVVTTLQLGSQYTVLRVVVRMRTTIQI